MYCKNALVLFFGLVWFSSLPLWAARINQGFTNNGRTSCLEAALAAGIWVDIYDNGTKLQEAGPLPVIEDAPDECSPFTGTFFGQEDIFQIPFVDAGESVAIYVNNASADYGVVSFIDAGFADSSCLNFSDITDTSTGTVFHNALFPIGFGDCFPSGAMTLYTSPGALQYISVTSVTGVESIDFGEKPVTTPEPKLRVLIVIAWVIVITAASSSRGSRFRVSPQKCNATDDTQLRRAEIPS